MRYAANTNIVHERVKEHVFVFRAERRERGAEEMPA